MIQMIIYDDREVLTSRTLWSNKVLESSRHICQRGLNVQAIMQALREEASHEP
jgi:heterodisulfide reductase subunit C